MTPDTFAHIPLAHIVTSRTNPRKHFNPVKLHELAESIRASGVHQPVLVRPLPGHRVEDTAHLDPRPQWELVSGERRLRASIAAEVDTIPAMVRALTDDQVLEIQLVENLQRDDLTPLEEAEGYDALMHAHEPPLTAEQIGQRIGKSRSYVYGRLKLLNLGPEGRQALEEGWLEPSTALLVARMPSHKLQKDALGNLKDWTGKPLSHRDAAAMIERQYMLKLSGAAFKITDATLLQNGPIKAGSCRECPKRTGTDPDLFADVKGADVCTDPACFKAKDDAHKERALKAARESGATIIEGREAKALVPHSYTGRVEGYLRLDNADDSPTDQPLRKIIGKLLEAEGITPTLVANPHKEGDLIAVVDHATASRLLAKKGHQEQAELIEAKASQSAKAAEEAQKAKDKERFEKAWRMELLRTTWAKIAAAAPGMYSVPQEIIRSLALGHVPNQEGCKELCKLLELGKVAPAEAVRDWITNHDDPDRALALMLMYQDREWQAWKGPNAEHNARLLALATDTGIDVDVEAIKAQVKKEHTAEIRARNKVQADKAAADPAKASAPLAPAAQLNGGRGKAGTKGAKGGKGKNAPAAPAARLSAGEAMLGIAAAMQSDEAGGDCAPGGADPAGGDAAGGDEGRATSPDAGAAPLVPGSRNTLANETSPTPVPAAKTGPQGRKLLRSLFLNPHPPVLDANGLEIAQGDMVKVVDPYRFTGKIGHVQRMAGPNGKVIITLEGMASEYVFAATTLQVVGELVQAWPFPKCKEGSA